MTAPFAIAEVIGTISFAISGYLVGSRKKLDLLGIAIVSMLTALGGGLVRDVLCGRIPNALRSPAPILLVSGTVVLAVLLRLHQRGEIELLRTGRRHRPGGLQHQRRPERTGSGAGLLRGGVAGLSDGCRRRYRPRHPGQRGAGPAAQRILWHGGHPDRRPGTPGPPSASPAPRGSGRDLPVRAGPATAGLCPALATADALDRPREEIGDA
jgi:hypothetical protein